LVARRNGVAVSPNFTVHRRELFGFRGSIEAREIIGLDLIASAGEAERRTSTLPGFSIDS
jgi:hypothetical protein